MPRRIVLILSLCLAVLLIAACESSEGFTLPEAQNAATNTAPPPTATPTISPQEATFIAGATITADFVATNPASEPTLVQSQIRQPNCSPGSSITFDGVTSERLQAALDTAEVKDTVISINRTQQTDDCITFVDTEVTFVINSTVGTVTNRDAVGNIAADALAVLDAQPDTLFPGTAPAVIIFNFDGNNDAETYSLNPIPYDAVQSAITEGLRGTALLERLEAAAN